MVLPPIEDYHCIRTDRALCGELACEPRDDFHKLIRCLKGAATSNVCRQTMRVVWWLGWRCIDRSDWWYGVTFGYYVWAFLAGSSWRLRLALVLLRHELTTEISDLCACNVVGNDLRFRFGVTCCVERRRPMMRNIVFSRWSSDFIDDQT
jgi:hypothetical protein